MQPKIKNLINQKDEKIQLGDLTILIGPNNSGKSRTLLDINELFTKGPQTNKVLIKNVEFEPISLDDFMVGLNVRPDPNMDGQYLISGLVPNLSSSAENTADMKTVESNLSVINKNGLQNFCNMGIMQKKIVLLDANRRLIIALTVGSTPADQAPQTPLQELFVKKDLEPILASAFKNAFNMEIKLDYSGLADLKFRVAEKLPETSKDPREARPILKDYPVLDDQGDGFKSFVGIVLGLILGEGRVILIDEPEAFLHPTQARVLGEWLSSYAKSKRQIVIATHSTDILDGLLLGNKDVTILRVDRKGNETNYLQISSETTKQLATMPLLSSQPVLESIFYKGVIVNEGDSDRVIYRSVYSKMSDKREHQFVDAFGKQTIKKIIKPLKEAKIPVCAVADMDILNSETELKELIESLGSTDKLGEILQVRKEIAESVEGMNEETILKNINTDIQKLSGKLDSGIELKYVRRELENIKQESGKWKSIKEKGIEGIQEPHKEKAKNLLDDLKKIGLFIPPVGELESWILVENEKWIIGAVKIIQEDKTPENLKSFVKELIDYLEK